MGLFETLFGRQKPVKMSPEKQAELIERFKDFREQPTLRENKIDIDDAEMISITRMVRKRRGNWWQLPKDFKEELERK